MSSLPCHVYGLPRSLEVSVHLLLVSTRCCSCPSGQCVQDESFSCLRRPVSPVAQPCSHHPPGVVKIWSPSHFSFASPGLIHHQGQGPNHLPLALLFPLPHLCSCGPRPASSSLCLAHLSNLALGAQEGQEMVRWQESWGMQDSSFWRGTWIGCPYPACPTLVRWGSSCPTESCTLLQVGVGSLWASLGLHHPISSDRSGCGLRGHGGRDEGVWCVWLWGAGFAHAAWRVCVWLGCRTRWASVPCLMGCGGGALES